jgi:hypothetical protein
MSSSPSSPRVACALLVLSFVFAGTIRAQKIDAGEYPLRSLQFAGLRGTAPSAPCPASAPKLGKSFVEGADDAPACDDADIPAVSVDPCAPGNALTRICGGAADPVKAQLAGLGKYGRTISVARERVLEILEAQNPCTAWFQEKDPAPAAAFRTLEFELDRNGEGYVLESRDLGPLDIFRNPYVARVFQDAGRYATITLNTKGAFFSPQARLLEVRKDGGPGTLRGPHLLLVGPYTGDTLPARMLALLHEFGHVLGLLPADRDNQDGKSMQNTHDVLRVCRAEVDARMNTRTVNAKHASVVASR